MFEALELDGAWAGALDCPGLLACDAGAVGVWVGVPGDDLAAATWTQFLLVAGLAARVSGAALAMPWVPSTSSTPPLTTPAAIVRTCTKHMKIVLSVLLVRSKARTLGSGRPEVAGFGTTNSYPLPQ